MADHEEDSQGAQQAASPQRRRFLMGATAVVGAFGIVGAAVPFVGSWEPSAKAKAQGAPVDVDVSKLEDGQMVTVAWRSRPTWILHRTQDQLKELSKLSSLCKDPDSKRDQQFGPEVVNVHRSIKPEHFVCVGICTHLGCIPDYHPKIGDPAIGPDWKGGFFCPCHGSRYDLAGRVLKGSPAPLNLPVVPYYYVNDHTIRIGALKDGSDQNWRPNTW